MQVGVRRGIPYAGRVLVTGDRGFLGHHIVPVLENRWKFADVIRVQGSSFFDLTQQNHIRTMFNSIETNHGPIKTVVHLAALSGGIKDNSERQASYFYQNMMMGINILEECAKRKTIDKLVMFMGGCSYPNKVGKDTPFTEEEMWDGLPVNTSLGYSFAKKAMLVGAWAYKQQVGLKTLVLMPTNLIGEWDNFDPDQSHVVPALIRRFVEARDEGYENVTVWGSGKPVRDFIYAGDVAMLLPDIIKNFDGDGPLNISTGKGTSIAEIAEYIAKATNYKGKIIFDTSKPDGQLYKVLDNSKLLTLIEESSDGAGFVFTPIEEAIQKTVSWFEERVGIMK
jgi:GDP-L-fucose synthase